MITANETGASRLAANSRAVSLDGKPIRNDFDNKVGNIVRQFPGPITLVPPRKSHIGTWFLILGGEVMMAVFLYLGVIIAFLDAQPPLEIGVVFGALGAAVVGFALAAEIFRLGLNHPYLILAGVFLSPLALVGQWVTDFAKYWPAAGVVACAFCAVFWGFFVAFGAIAQRPGTNALRLDDTGFEVTRLFQKKVFRWSDVSDFSVSLGSLQPPGLLLFKAAKPRLTNADEVAAYLQRGPNESLPDTYGFAEKDFLHLMTSWQKLALNEDKRA